MKIDKYYFGALSLILFSFSIIGIIIFAVYKIPPFALIVIGIGILGCFALYLINKVILNLAEELRKESGEVDAQSRVRGLAE